MEDSDSDSKYESDDNQDKSYDSDKAAELLTSRFALSRRDNNEQYISSDEDADSNNKDDKTLNTKSSAKQKK
eukprot:13333602-Ditylum_brightwellii.AAC.1